MGKMALKLGGDTFAFFTRNPRGGNAKAINPKDIEVFKRITAEHNITPILLIRHTH